MAHKEQEQEQDPETKTVTITGTSKIQIRFIAWMLGTCAVGFGTWIWWAATISSKIDTLLTGQAAQSLAVKGLSDDVSRLKEWRTQVDAVGSPVMVRRVDDLSKAVNDLQKAFEMHVATTVKSTHEN